MKRKLLLLALTGIVSLTAFSRDLNLDQALKIAEQQNPEVRKHLLTLDIRKLEEKRRRKAFLPSVDLSVSRDNAYDDNLDPFDQSGGLEATISMPLFTGFKLTSEYEKAKIATAKVEAQKTLLKYGTREDVIGKYFEVLNSKKQVEILESVNGTLEKQHDRMEKLYENNKLVRKSEVLKVKSDIISNQVLLLRAKQQEDIQTNELQVLLGLPIDEELNITDYDYTERDISDFSVEADTRKVLEDGSEMKISKLDVEDKKEDVTIARSYYYPTVGLGLQKNFKREQDGLDSYRIGIGFTWNIFRWGSDMDRVSQSEDALEIAKIDMETQKSKTNVELKAKYTDMITYSKQLEAQKLKLEIAEENAKVDTLRYNNSLMNSFEYLDSIDRLRQAQEEFYTTQREYMLSIDTYENAWK